MAAPKIPFSKREYEVVKQLVESGDFKDLASILAKMEKAMIPRVIHGFLDEDARRVANEMMGDNVYFATSTPNEIAKHNAYLKRFNISEDDMRKACKVAMRSWRKPIFFDTILFSVRKLAAMPVFTEADEQPKNVFGSE